MSVCSEGHTGLDKIREGPKIGLFISENYFVRNITIRLEFLPEVLESFRKTCALDFFPPCSQELVSGMSKRLIVIVRKNLTWCSRVLYQMGVLTQG